MTKDATVPPTGVRVPERRAPPPAAAAAPLPSRRSLRATADRAALRAALLSPWEPLARRGEANWGSRSRSCWGWELEGRDPSHITWM